MKSAKARDAAGGQEAGGKGKDPFMTPTKKSENS